MRFEELPPTFIIMSRRKTTAQFPDDKRTLSPEAKEAMRISTAQSIVDGELTAAEAARQLGVAESAPYRWAKTLREHGIEALRRKKAPGRALLLSPEQIELVREILVSTSPPFWGFKRVLWTRAMVAELVWRAFKVDYSEEGIGRLMRKEMKLSIQRPVRRAYEADEAAVERWLVADYPAIAKKARKNKAMIFFSDEAGVRSDYHSGTTWAPVGNTPVVEGTGARFGINLISAVSASGELRWMEVDGRMTAAKFIDFLKRMIKGREDPVYLIVDNHPTHHAKAVKRFVESTDGALELHFLPAYSPQLNPDELIWNQVKNHTTGRSLFHTVGHLREIAHSCLRSLQRQPQLIRRFFRELHVRCAAAT